MKDGLPPLDLPDHGVKTKHDAEGARVFDPVRKQWVALTPEEWVRQHFLNHLVHDLGCPLSLIAVESGMRYNRMDRRTDILVHDRQGRAVALVECKAPSVRISAATFEQAARYNTVHQVPWLIVTNGLRHFCCAVDHELRSTRFVQQLPDFATMCGP